MKIIWKLLGLLKRKKPGKVKPPKQWPDSPDKMEYHYPPRHTPIPTIEVLNICKQLGLKELAEKIASDPPPKTFESDGCSSWLQEWKGKSLYPACFKHDLKYWAGRKGEEIERLVADAELAIDVAKDTGSTYMAQVLFNGVRAGGTDKFKLPFSWGYGRDEKSNK